MEISRFMKSAYVIVAMYAASWMLYCTGTPTTELIGYMSSAAAVFLYTIIALCVCMLAYKSKSKKQLITSAIVFCMGCVLTSHFLGVHEEYIVESGDIRLTMSCGDAHKLEEAVITVRPVFKYYNKVIVGTGVERSAFVERSHCDITDVSSSDVISVMGDRYHAAIFKK